MADSVTGQAPTEVVRRAVRNEEEGLPVDDDGFGGSRHSHMKYELRDTPGLGNVV